MTLNLLSLRYLSFFVLALALFGIARAHDKDSYQEKDGTLVVVAIYGDIDNTPATDVYVEAHGFVHKYHSEKSYVLKSSRAGRYEAPLPPAVYDVFVSEGVSEPRCRRLLVKAGSTSEWILKFDNDEVFTER